MTMTPEAKSFLSKTIRRLRTRLLDDFRSSSDSTYQFAIRNLKDAKLDNALSARRRRIEAWLDEQVRSEAGKKNKRTAEDFRRDLEQQAAYTLLNRLLILRLMEAGGLRYGTLAAQGWNSETYKTFRQIAPVIIQDDETEGFAFLMQLVLEDLAVDMLGLYGPAGVAELIPVPPATLRAVIEALADPRLDSCWTDDMTLGWVYQYWNDPQREALDAKINAGGKIEPHEIASKTQMFTERYMVDWLLQNSLGPMWLAMCKKHGWTSDAESTGTLDELEQRRGQWRAKRDAGEVELTELMPLNSDLERQWAYYVPQPIPDDAVDQAPDSVRDLRVLDPAVGSGHFLIVAFDLLLALYREEARHRGETQEGDGIDDEWSDRAIVERILEHNLHGIDLDPRAVQIAAAALWLKARSACPEAHPRQLNLVASNLRLGSLPHDDPALVELRRVVEEETGMPADLTDTIVQALRGADHLGSLLQIDKAVDEAIDKHEKELATRPVTWQREMFGTPTVRQKRIDFDATATRRSLLDGLDVFLSRHTSGEDLGLRTRGEQLAAGVRFMRLVKEGSYDLVVANPPYQGTSKMAASSYIDRHYKLGKADLYAAFLLRGLQLVREGGVSAMLTMRNWMFIKQYAALRESLLRTYDLTAIGDFEVGAFEEVGGMVVSVSVSVFRRSEHESKSVGQRLTLDVNESSSQRTARKRAATLCHVGRHDFDPAALKVVPEWPLVYWWDEAMLQAYQSAPLIGDVSPAREGITTGDNARFRRWVWETFDYDRSVWKDFLAGASGQYWLAPQSEVINWGSNGLGVKVKEGATIRNERFQLQRGVAYTTIGSRFGGRAFRTPCIFEATGRSIFHSCPAYITCVLNSSVIRSITYSLNPGIHFTVGDVNRLPLFPIADSDRIFSQVEAAFSIHESHREPSVEFKRPGPSPWRHAQEWAQEAVDRPDGEPLPEYVEQLDPEPPTDHLSFALGVALGRFGGDGEGILDPATADLSAALPAGLLFINTTLSDHETSDSLGHAAAKLLVDAWETYGPQIARDSGRKGLRRWLAGDFFKDVHKGMYENRPIHWPLSSAKRTFVAWVNIHRLDGSTLRVLLADHLQPTLTRLEGELQDLRSVRDGTDRSAARNAEKRFAQVQKWRDELAEFISLVEQCGERGAPPTDAKCPQREVDARYEPDLDDGVMINSAALWPLLEPQWKEPKKWWKELSVASPKGNKDYDWSHLAMRYWPTRVDAKCQEDPSLGVAHGCFWKYHPERAWAWELRLQEEIGPDFRIEESPYRGDEGDREHRDRFLAEHGKTALEVIEKEVHRRRRGTEDKVVESLTILEPGLWEGLPDQCWQTELAIIRKQQHDFRLFAPDEEPARAKLLAEKPNLARERDKLLKKQGATARLF